MGSASIALVIFYADRNTYGRKVDRDKTLVAAALYARNTLMDRGWLLGADGCVGAMRVIPARRKEKHCRQAGSMSCEVMAGYN